MSSAFREMLNCCFKIFVVLAVIMALFISAGCGKGKQSGSEINFGAEYQAVFLDNGQVFFGKLSESNSEYPLLKDVFYVQNQTNPDTNEVKSILIKRGHEWHGPSSMRINSKHIILMEPVGADSQVSELIKEASTKK